ncbi:MULTISPECIES: hypothetical protein [unclassified Dysgonomonas]|uniref:hypothetical protein n=1 Tax=unclassified Dysgonomonas TaxID=2630389 RepID=UPI0013EC915E|nr:MULTISPECIES: hypothetical protein [unclassified Dysgonomonas]
MIRKGLYSLLLVIVLTSCASTFGVANLNSKIKKLELGMTKKEALSIVGKEYDLVVASQTADGRLEVLRFTPVAGRIYLLHFLNGELVEYHEEVPFHGPRDVRIINEDINE